MILTNFEKIQAIQSVLGLKQTGLKDAETDAAYAALGERDKMLPTKLPWTAEIDGEDLVVRNVRATCFGGIYDRGDNGQTESGIPDKTNPAYLVALPIRSTEVATANSPLAFKGPHIPWKTPVKVWLEANGEDTAVYALLADNGPATNKYPTHALDLDPPLALHFVPAFNPEEIANEWSGEGFSYRIIGGAKWVS